MSVNKVNSDGSLSRVAGGTLYADMAVGSIVPFGGSVIPSGYLLCDGQAVSRTTYAELFAVIGIAFGTGDGSTTFNIPDLRESVPKGAGLTGKTVGAHLDADGLAVGEFLDDRVQEHSHEYQAIAEPGLITVQGNGWNVKMVDTQSMSGRKGATTEVKSVGVNYIIKAKQVAVPADFRNAIVKHTEVTFTSVTVNGNTKKNVGSLTSTLPTGSRLVGFNVISGIDSDMIPYISSGNLMVRNFNSSSITINSATVDIFYI